ncbi:MAG: GreA/GreB family elongation factor [Deltaproteobacteria bacterium]|jgi:transcription elongation GreA/GreB family factor|nr:GreA/GreB family elongation factor [Deltaproteobacteria bacterium]
MNKSALIAHIIQKLETELAALKAAALETYAAATGDESKPENKYDTRALEASYLAGAQAKRVRDTEGSLAVFRVLKPKSFTGKSQIESTALVEVDLDGKTTFVFIAPARGSLTIDYEGRSIQVITPQSPLGEGLLGLRVGDMVKIDQGSRQLEYEIVSVE